MLSCSLKYEEQVDTAAVTPELELIDAELTQYKDNKVSLRLSSDILEQYKSDNSTFAQGVNFKSWDDKGELETEGKCDLLGLNREEEIYTLFNNIYLNNVKQGFVIRAQNLKWISKSEQLLSGKDDTVYIERDDITIEGAGFTASGVSQTFEFAKPVSGIITVNEDKEDAQQQEENNIEEQ